MSTKEKLITYLNAAEQIAAIASKAGNEYIAGYADGIVTTLRQLIDSIQ